jgi:hypothetical protein
MTFAGIGERHDFRARRLRLQQERREIRGVEGMSDHAKHLAARCEHGPGRIAFQRLAERNAPPSVHPARVLCPFKIAREPAMVAAELQAKVNAIQPWFYEMDLGNGVRTPGGVRSKI